MLRLEKGGRSWATLELRSIGGTGRLNPRLQLNFATRPAPYAKVVLEDITLRLEYRQELIGEGRAVGAEVQSDNSMVTFEVVTSQRLLQYITDGLQSSTTMVNLEAKLSGVGVVTMDENLPDESGWTRLPTDPCPGESKRITFSNSMASPLQVSRTEWYERVLAPTRNEQYRYLEIVLPKDDKALDNEWTSSVNHLVDAERAYAAGDDPAVFFYLYGALESLPGAKQKVLDNISDPQKREHLDAILKKAGEYLHSGRHVAADGTQQGTFPVDHLDAAFAINLIRVLLSHFSLMLAAERRRAAEQQVGSPVRPGDRNQRADQVTQAAAPEDPAQGELGGVEPSAGGSDGPAPPRDRHRLARTEPGMA